MPAISFALPDLVVVTGAASGLGESLCEVLLEHSVRVVGVDLVPSKFEGGAGFDGVAGSVAVQETWNAVLAKVDAAGPARIGLVTSAAILDTGFVPEATAQVIARVMEVNVTGTALAMAALIPHMERMGGGAIVAIASVNAMLAEQQLAIYNASKAAVRQLARTAALDHAPRGVRVNVVSPGPMMAGLFKRHLESATDSAKFLAARARRQPQGRILDARDVAQAAVFLLSDGAGAILGADIIADGGLTAGFDFRTGAEGASV
jgi:NAD(P)-dependent dehydrogenase (short-subunit alcohol dehydrogenase family)